MIREEDLIVHIEDDLRKGAFSVSEQIENQRVIGLIEDYLHDAEGKGHSWSDKAISLIYHIYNTNLYTVYLDDLPGTLVFEVDLDENTVHFAVEELIYRADEPVPEDNTEYLNDLSGYNQEMTWERAQEAAQPSDAEIERLAEEAFEAAAPSVLMEDSPMHTEARPFCSDPSCPCHWDYELVHKLLTEPYFDGLLTSEEANRLHYGLQV
jgi:hypothetical protein